eukprot:9483292-Pyramimonas_sp.AAC.1
MRTEVKTTQDERDSISRCMRPAGLKMNANLIQDTSQIPSPLYHDNHTLSHDETNAHETGSGQAQPPSYFDCTAVLCQGSAALRIE